MVASTLPPPTDGSTPDPTVLTTAALARAIEAVKELYDEKLRAVYDQLQLVERQRVEQKADTKAAVDAALTAQKEAVKEQTAATDKAISKTEVSTAEQLRQLAATFQAGLSSQATIVSDLKDRVVAIESTRLGGREQKIENRQVTAGLYAAVGIAITLILAVLSVLAFANGGGG